MIKLEENMTLTSTFVNNTGLKTAPEGTFGFIIFLKTTLAANLKNNIRPKTTLDPALDFTKPMSEALIVPPLAVTSERKFVAVTSCPDCALVRPMSLAVTEPLPVVSPTRIATGRKTSAVALPL